MTDMHDIAQRSLASQDKWELEQMLLEVEKIHPKKILEVGVHLGGGMRVYQEAFEPEFLLGLERDTNYEYPGLNVMTGVNSHNPEVLWSVFEKGPFQFAMIDGDHSRNGVLADFLCYSAVMEKGKSIMAFHDIRIEDNPTCEVFQFWKEMKKQECYTYKEILNPEGLGTGVGLIFI